MNHAFQMENFSKLAITGVHGKNRWLTSLDLLIRWMTEIYICDNYITSSNISRLMVI